MGGVAEGGPESDRISRQPSYPRLNPAITALAARQHGVVHVRQLEALGLSARGVQHRAAGRRLHRIHRGVYSVAPLTVLSREARWLAAVLASPPGAVASHRTAAALLGLLRYEGEKIEVTVPGPHSRKRGHLVVHGSKTLTPQDVTLVNNIPCTTVARTLFDLAEMVDRRRLERAFDQSEVLELFDLGAIEDQLGRNATRRAAGIVRALLKEHYIGSAPTESELEEAFLALCRSAGLPKPAVQQWLFLGDGGPPIRADFLWREQRVVVETDGAKVHGTRQARPRDARRDQRLTVHRWRPIRTDWRQVMRRPAELEATLVALVSS